MLTLDLKIKSWETHVHHLMLNGLVKLVHLFDDPALHDLKVSSLHALLVVHKNHRIFDRVDDGIYKDDSAQNVRGNRHSHAPFSGRASS